MRLHFSANGRAHGFGLTRSVFDFFLPIGHRIRCEASVSADSQNGVTERHFYTFRAFVLHCFYQAFVEPLREYRELSRMVPNFSRFGAIALDAATTIQAVTPGSGPLNYSLTTAGSNRLILSGVNMNDDTVTGATYNTVAESQLVKKQISAASTTAYLYGLVAPTTGSNTVSVSWTGSKFVRSSSTSYSGVKQSSLPDAVSSVSGTDSNSSITLATITVADNCWLASFQYADASGGTDSNPSAGTGATSRANTGTSIFLDSNGSVGSAGSHSMQTTYGSNTASYSIVQVSFAPYLPTQILTESVSLTDSAPKLPGKLASESMTATDSILRSIARSLAETTTIGNVLATLKLITANMTLETVALTQSILRSVGRTLSETPTLTDSVPKTTSRILSDAMTLVDTIRKLPGKLLADSLAIADAILRSIGKLYSEAVTLTQSLINQASRTLIETITLTQTFTRGLTYVRALLENLTITDRIKTYFNGLNTFFSHKYEPQNTSYTRKHSRQGTSYEKKYPPS